MRFGDLTYLEIREKATTGWLAIIPTGCTEQQGPHLPVDFDTWFAETMMLAAADYAHQHFTVGALVLPALPFGPTPEHRNFGSGYIDLPRSLHHAVIRNVLGSLAIQGFQRMVLWRGCGGHQLQTVVDQFNAQHVHNARAFQPDFPYHAAWCRIADPDIPGGHADSFTTAMAMHLRPNCIRYDKIRNPQNTPVAWDDPKLDFARYSTTGVIGDPTHATPELGAQLWAELVPTCAQILADIVATPI